MPKLSTRALLLRLGTAFALSLASLTVLLFAREASRWIPQLSARGAPGSAIAEAMVMTLPHTLALTFPMAVFLAVSWVLARLGTEGRLAEARRDPRELRRMMRPVLVAAAAVAVFTSVWNAEMLPRANARLVAVLVGAPVAPTDRTMTIAELSAAAERVRATRGPSGEARAAAYEVELHKKFALGAACMFLALLAAATSIRFPRGGLGLVLGTSPVVFAVYWLVAVAGEYLADELLLSPFVAMWLANAVLLVVALLLVRRPSPPENMRGAEALAIDP